MSFMIFHWLLAYGLYFFVVWVLGQLHSRHSSVGSVSWDLHATILRTRPSASEPRLSGRAPKEEETRWPGRHLGNSVNVAEWWDFADERMSGVRQLSPFFRRASSVLHFLLLSVPRPQCGFLQKCYWSRSAAGDEEWWPGQCLLLVQPTPGTKWHQFP